MQGKSRCNGCGVESSFDDMEEIESEFYCEKCAAAAWLEAEKGQGWFGGEVR